MRSVTEQQRPGSAQWGINSHSPSRQDDFSSHSQLRGKGKLGAASHAAQKSWDLGSVSGVSPRVLTKDVINKWISEQVQGPHSSIRTHMVPFFALYHVYLHPHYLVFCGLDFGKETLFSQRANFSLSRTLGFRHKPLQ